MNTFRRLIFAASLLLLTLLEVGILNAYLNAYLDGAPAVTAYYRFLGSTGFNFEWFGWNGPIMLIVFLLLLVIMYKEN